MEKFVEPYSSGGLQSDAHFGELVERKMVLRHAGSNGKDLPDVCPSRFSHLN